MNLKYLDWQRAPYEIVEMPDFSLEIPLMFFVKNHTCVDVLLKCTLASCVRSITTGNCHGELSLEAICIVPLLESKGWTQPLLLALSGEDCWGLLRVVARSLGIEASPSEKGREG